MLIRKNYSDNISPNLLGYVSKGAMQRSEQFFISGLIREYKPEKVLEVGVATGASSLVIMDALGNGGRLYSHDYSSASSIGYIVKCLPDMTAKWTLRTGGMCCNYLDEFCSDGKKFDICFLDTAHRNPGEFLDFLQILPYMKKGGIIIMHDISIHTFCIRREYTTCCVLFSAIKGQKILPAGNFFVNIGAVILDDDIMENVFDIFNCIRLPWLYNISGSDITAIKKCFSKYYPEDLLELFEEYCNYSPRKKHNNGKILKALKTVKNNLWI